MNSAIHMLNQLGVMASLSIAKNITEQEINKYFIKHKKLGKNNAQITEMLKKKIISDIQKSILKKEIPGLIIQNDITDSAVIHNIPEINKITMVLVQKMIEKQYDKMTLCYFINNLVNMFGLTEEDFTRFHKQNGDGEDETGGDDEDDGNDEFVE